MADDPAPSPDVPDYADRVDALLSSALADQAKEKRQLVETLYGAKTALNRAEEEINSLKDLIVKRDEQLLEQIDKRLERLSDVEDAILKLARSVSQMPAKFRGDIETAAVAIGERLGEESDNLLRCTREDALEVVATFGKATERTVSQLREVVEGAREEYRTTTEQLASYLGQRDDSLQRARDQVLIDLFKQLAESLGRRNAKKVSQAIADDPQFGRPPALPGAPQPKQKRSILKSPQAPPQRQSPVYGPPGGQGGGEGPFSAERPSRQPPEPNDPITEHSYPDDEHLDSPAQPLANPLTRGELARDYLIPVSPYDSPKDSSAANEAAGGVFGSTGAREAAPNRVRRTKPPTKPPGEPKAKGPSQRAPRRKP